MVVQTLRYSLCACPKCFSGEIRVSSTYYTDEGRIVRQRRCLDCEHKWNTIQELEQVLPSTIKILTPSWRNEEGRMKIVELVDLAESA
jgi:transcriptional regulator NrdR family protein